MLDEATPVINEIKLNISSYLEESLQDGIGCNLVIVFQGCNFHCPGCHNPDSWAIGTGVDVSIDEALSHLSAVTSGITLSGGEPTLQLTAAAALLTEAKSRGLRTTLYTGLTEIAWFNSEASTCLAPLLDYVKIGPYVEALRNTTKGMMGSSNQLLYKITTLDKCTMYDIVDLNKGDNKR